MPSQAPDILEPTLERSAHGLVERIDQPIKDTNGAIARPYRSIDILAALYRRGAITAEMRDAGETFRTKFTYSHHEQLRAANLLRTGGAKSPFEPHATTYAAREHVWLALSAIGGLASAGGACLWHVVGLEQSLKEWALTQGWAGRRVNQEVASGILIASLGALAEHYRVRPV